MSNLPKDSNGWSKYQLFVIKKLDGLEDRMERLERENALLKTQIAVLNAQFKIKSGIWGALGGILPAGVVIAYMILG